MKILKDLDLRDLHIYGGLLCVGVGLSLAVSVAVALITVGSVAAYLGIWRL